MKNHAFQLLSFLGLLFFSSCSEKAPPADGPEELPVIKSGAVTVNYQSCGAGDTTLFFIHGWCINQTYWQAQVEAFCENYHVITMDLPGFGKSGKNREEWAIEQYAADVAVVFDSLNLKNVILVGHSMAGDIVLEAAINYPQQVIAVVGVDNFKDVGVPYTEEVQAEIDGFIQMLQVDYQQTVAGYADAFLFHESTDSLLKERIIADFVRADSAIATASLIKLFDYGQRESDRLAKLQQKLYLINSDATPTYIEGLDATGVQYEMLDIPATGHYPMAEKPAIFNQLLKVVLTKR